MQFFRISSPQPCHHHHHYRSINDFSCSIFSVRTNGAREREREKLKRKKDFSRVSLCEGRRRCCCRVVAAKKNSYIFFFSHPIGLLLYVDRVYSLSLSLSLTLLQYAPLYSSKHRVSVSSVCSRRERKIIF